MVLCACNKQTIKPAKAPAQKAANDLLKANMLSATGDENLNSSGHGLVLVKTPSLMKIFMRTGRKRNRWLQLNFRRDQAPPLSPNYINPVPGSRNPPSNYDIWHFRTAAEAFRSSATSFTFLPDSNLVCESGEWEFGLLQKGAPDHCGGAVHGSEVKYNSLFKVDFEEEDENGSMQKECDQINFLQSSYIYEWNKYQPYNIMAKLTKVYTLKTDSIIIKYNITFVKPVQITTIRFGMLPATRVNKSGALVTKWGTRTVNGSVSPVVDISTRNFLPVGILTSGNPNTSKINLWGDDFAASVETTRSEILPSSRMTVSDDYAYNKIYPDLLGGYVLMRENKSYTFTARYYLGLKK